MIELSWLTVSESPMSCSAGTSEETPPLPCSPWHDEHANWTNRCAPIATWGSLGFVPLLLPPPPQLLRANTAAKQMTREPTAGTARRIPTSIRLLGQGLNHHRAQSEPRSIRAAANSPNSPPRER